MGGRLFPEEAHNEIGNPYVVSPLIIVADFFRLCYLTTPCVY
jgi:hypothetical protein